MVQRKPRYSKEEFAARGEAIFERKIKASVQNEDPSLYVAIDIETEDFEVDRDSMAATDRLVAKNPDAQIWMRRVGFRWTFRLGTLRPLEGFRMRKVERCEGT